MQNLNEKEITKQIKPVSSNPTQSKRRIYINDINGCLVWVQPDYLTPKEAHELYLDCQKNLEWIQHTIKLFGKDIKQPRLTCSLGKPYEFSGSIHPVSQWTDKTKALLEKLNLDLGTTFNQCLANKYRDGNDYIGPHSDEKKNLSRNGMVAGISLGEIRKMVLSEKKGDKKVKIALAPGSLFVMEGNTQDFWKHSIPKESRIKKDRISLTFREFKE